MNAVATDPGRGEVDRTSGTLLNEYPPFAPSSFCRRTARGMCMRGFSPAMFRIVAWKRWSFHTSGARCARVPVHDIAVVDIAGSRPGAGAQV